MELAGPAMADASLQVRDRWRLAACGHGYTACGHGYTACGHGYTACGHGLRGLALGAAAAAACTAATACRGLGGGGDSAGRTMAEHTAAGHEEEHGEHAEDHGHDRAEGVGHRQGCRAREHAHAPGDHRGQPCHAVGYPERLVTAHGGLGTHSRASGSR